MGVLKYRKLDEAGRLIIETGRTWYIAQDERTGEIRKYSKKKKTGGNPNPKPSGQGFDKNPQNINSNRKKAKMKKKPVKPSLDELDRTDLWKENQIACLRRMLKMPRNMLLSYMVLWKLMEPAMMVTKYDYEPDAKDLGKLDQSEPTMIQITSVQMVLQAQADAKFAIKLMEMLEGKAVSQEVIAKKIEQLNKQNVVEEHVESEIDKALEKLRKDALSTIDNSEKHTNNTGLEKSNDDKENNLLESILEEKNDNAEFLAKLMMGAE